MQKRVFNITANDDDLLIEIQVAVTPRKGYALEENELDEFMKKAGRRIAAVLPDLPYSDFGIDNTQVVLEGDPETV